jgi:hypothetical protein
MPSAYGHLLIFSCICSDARSLQRTKQSDVKLFIVMTHYILSRAFFYAKIVFTFCRELIFVSNSALQIVESSFLWQIWLYISSRAFFYAKTAFTFCRELIFVSNSGLQIIVRSFLTRIKLYISS